MRPHLPWLSQGDIFGSLPIVSVRLDSANSPTAEMAPGPAVLVSHDCALDKPDKATGLPRVERVQLARLRTLKTLTLDKQNSLRAGRLGPYEALYLNEPSPLGESFLLLDDVYSLPASYLALKLRAHPSHPESESPEALYTTPTVNDSRIGRLDEAQLDLLHKKMIAFWTRQRVVEQ